MGNLARYGASDLPALLDRINKHSIGMDQYFDRLFQLQETSSNYPPYNLIQVSSTESLLELALAGFKPKNVKVYTEDGKLFVEGQKDDDPSGLPWGIQLEIATEAAIWPPLIVAFEQYEPRL